VPSGFPKAETRGFFSVIVLLHRYSDRLSGNTVQYDVKEIKEVGDMRQRMLCSQPPHTREDHVAH
jgi:hypothetical protein